MSLGIVDFMEKIAAPDWEPEPDAVVTLTKHNFHEVVNKEELMLVEFYAPWFVSLIVYFLLYY